MLFKKQNLTLFLKKLNQKYYLLQMNNFQWNICCFLANKMIMISEFFNDNNNVRKL